MIVYEYTTRRRRIAEIGPSIHNPIDGLPVLRALIDDSEVERLVVLVLDSKNKPIASEVVYIGNLAGAPVRVGEVFRLAVRMNGASILVGHNHPSGDPAPSAEDIAVTRELAEAGKLLDIDLLDHIVLGDGNRFASLRSIGALL